jgi:hypothetical protein
MSAPTPAQNPVATARRTGASDMVSRARRGISDAERQATYAAVGSIFVLGILDAIDPEIPDTTFSARQAAGTDRNRAPGGHG